METQRKYMIRVTRHPLTDDQITKLAAAGTLPADHRFRSVIADDFVEVFAGNDLDARAKALARTALEFKGEEAEVREVLGTNHLRLLEAP